MNKFDFLRAYCSPFKPPAIKLYVGKVAIGTPYFFPRRWVKDKLGYLKAVPKKIGFDFVGLGWKTKWNRDDYRFEWSPIWSFVFFGYQIAITFVPPEYDHYWECWLYYTHSTYKSRRTAERIADARKEFPCVWIKSAHNGEKATICYWDLILKNNYL